MKLTTFSLRNPLIITAITVVLALFGIYAYSSMGIGLLPNFSEPVVQVITTEAGADPASVETRITKPIEDAIAALPNVKQITSSSTEGVSSVSVEFTTSANTDLIAVDVERAVNSIRSKVPTDTDAPAVQKFDVNQIPVVIVSLSGPQPLDQIQQVASDRLKRTLESVKGVASVTLTGGRDHEVQVKVDLDKLQAHGLGLNSVQQALASQQLELPAGTLTSATKAVNVRLDGLVSTPDQLGDIVVAQTVQGPVRVKDVATIDDTVKKAATISRVNGVPAVSLTVTKLNSANALQVSKDVHKLLDQLQPTLPHGMHTAIGFDTATYTQQSFNTIQKTLLEAIALTGLILLLFLHTWRSTLIVLVAIPTSVLSTFGWMSVMGINLNLFSMLALTLAVGILVDDSIVVLENVYRHLGLREPPLLAAINGRNEIGLAAITITMVDVVVYLPIALIPNYVGQVLQSFALVITAATLTSLLVSFTLTPLLASRYLRAEHALQQRGGWLARFGQKWDAGFERLGQAYRRLLTRVLTGRILRFIPRRGGRRGISARWAVIVAGVLSFVAGLALLALGLIGFDIFPSGDQSEVDVQLVMPSATALESTDATAKQIEQRLRSVPEVREVFSFVGQGGGNGATSASSANMYVLLAPRDERARGSQQIADDLDQHLAVGIPGAKVRVGLPNAFGFGGFGGQPIQVVLRGPNPEQLNTLVDQVEGVLKSIPGTADVNNSNEITQPEYVIKVDQTHAADLGITSDQASQALRTAVDGTVVTKYRRPGQDDVDVRLIAGDGFRASPSNLGSLPLLSSKGTLVSLGQLGDIRTGTAPTVISHQYRDRSVTISASTVGRLPGDVQNELVARLGKLALPPGYSIDYNGQAKEGASAFNDMYKAMAIGLGLMYLLMLMLFGSVMLPLAVLMSLPLAVVGSFGAMAATHTPFTLFSLLGFSLLIGLVGKNAILLVDYTDTLRKRGENRTEALLQAGPTRLRPIVMTTVSVIAALAPVALGLEAGSELLKAAAIVLIGGLITSTLLTLVFVPAMYTIFDDVQSGIVGLARRFSQPRQFEPEELAILHPDRSPLAASNGHDVDDTVPREALV
ncbi:MAG TPA: efflux RND transporter permease subunit [Chloroflexota bacterium]